MSLSPDQPILHHLPFYSLTYAALVDPSDNFTSSSPKASTSAAPASPTFSVRACFRLELLEVQVPSDIPCINNSPENYPLQHPRREFLSVSAPNRASIIQLYLSRRRAEA